MGDRSGTRKWISSRGAGLTYVKMTPRRKYPADGRPTFLALDADHRSRGFEDLRPLPRSIPKTVSQVFVRPRFKRKSFDWRHLAPQRETPAIVDRSRSSICIEVLFGLLALPIVLPEVDMFQESFCAHW